MKDDDDSIGFDLAAWEAPPAPSVADAVLARMREPVRATAAIEPEPSRRTPMWIGGVVAAAAIAGVVVLAQRESAEPLTGSGAVAAARPSRIDLGNASSATLDGATDVHWVRDGHRLVALQPRGTATWQVADDDSLVIDAGAAVASVRASGASLRVEVDMQFTGTHMIGASAGTAVVAAVTVIVFQGQVEVAGNGATTKVVQAGETIAILPGKSPAEPPLVAGGPVMDPRKAEILRLEREIQRLEAEQKRMMNVTTIDADDPSIAKQVGMLRKVLGACDRSRAISVVLAIEPDGRAFPKDVKPITALACVATATSAMKFAAGGHRETTFQADTKTTAQPPVTVQPSAPPPSTSCADTKNLTAAETEADALLAAANYYAVLTKLDPIVKCKPQLLLKAYLAACRTKSFVKAKALFKQIPAQRQPQMAQICIQMGFDPREP